MASDKDLCNGLLDNSSELPMKFMSEEQFSEMQKAAVKDGKECKKVKENA